MNNTILIRNAETNRKQSSLLVHRHLAPGHTESFTAVVKGSVFSPQIWCGSPSSAAERCQSTNGSFSWHQPEFKSCLPLSLQPGPTFSRYVSRKRLPAEQQRTSTELCCSTLHEGNMNTNCAGGSPHGNGPKMTRKSLTKAASSIFFNVNNLCLLQKIQSG